MNFAARKEHPGGYKVTQLQIINSQFSRVFTKEDLENIPEWALILHLAWGL